MTSSTAASMACAPNGQTGGWPSPNARRQIYPLSRKTDAQYSPSECQKTEGAMRHNRARNRSTDDGRAATAYTGQGAWLRATPATAASTIANEAFRSNLGHRLGLDGPGAAQGCRRALRLGTAGCAGPPRGGVCPAHQSPWSMMSFRSTRCARTEIWFCLSEHTFCFPHVLSHPFSRTTIESLNAPKGIQNFGTIADLFEFVLGTFLNFA